MISYPALPDAHEDRMKEDKEPTGGTPPPEYTEKIDKQSNKDAESLEKGDGDLFTITRARHVVGEKRPSPPVPPTAVVARRQGACSFSTAWKVVMTILFILVLTSVLFLATLYIKACGQCMAPRSNHDGYNRLPSRGYPLPLPQLNSETPLGNSVDSPSDAAIPHPLPPPPPPMPPCRGGVMGPFPPPPPPLEFPMPPMPCFPPGGFHPFPPLPPPPMIFFPPPPPHFVEFLFPGLLPSQQSLIEKSILEKNDGPIPPPPHLLPFLPMPLPVVEKPSSKITIGDNGDSIESEKKNVTAKFVARRNRRLKFRKLKRRLNTTNCCDDLCLVVCESKA